MSVRRPSPYELRSLFWNPPTVLSLPNMLTAVAWHSFRRFLLSQLLFADRAWFGHRVSHSLAPRLVDAVAKSTSRPSQIDMAISLSVISAIRVAVTPVPVLVLLAVLQLSESPLLVVLGLISLV